MANTPVFNISTADIQAEVNPQSLPYFIVGAGAGKVSADVVEAQALASEAEVLSSVPERYRRMLRRIDGLIVVRCATKGQDEFSLPFGGFSDVAVFVNYPVLSRGMRTCANPRAYGYRTLDDALDTTTYTVGIDGTVTLLSPLEAGDTVIVDFNHTGANLVTELRQCTITLASARLLLRMPSLSQTVQDRADAWRADAQLYLRRLWNSDANSQYMRTGIDTLDRLELVESLETRMPGGEARQIWGNELI